jgi:hypothetical protein
MWDQRQIKELIFRMLGEKLLLKGRDLLVSEASDPVCVFQFERLHIFANIALLIVDIRHTHGTEANLFAFV